MQPFELPEFYMPYPARLNPNLEGARAHSKAWAYEFDMIDVPQHGRAIWDEHDFDSHDYALLCSYTHPDATGPALDLVTDWYVWVFYFDDHFLELYKKTRDLAGAREYLDRLPAFMPLDGVQTEEPTNPVERGLADLWTRTVPDRTLDWRRRFAESTKNLLAESRWELANISESRLPNPIEYIEMRRKVGGAPWSANLVEHARTPRCRPRSPRAGRCGCFATPSQTGCTCATISFPTNAKWSRRARSTTACWCSSAFSTCPPSEPRTWSTTCSPRGCTSSSTPPSPRSRRCWTSTRSPRPGRLQVLAYVKGLQDWQAGGHEWHLRSSRYMNQGGRAAGTGLLGGPLGLGTAAARIGSSLVSTAPQRIRGFSSVPYRVVGPTPIPDVYMPFGLTLSPHLDAARQHLLDWSARIGISDGTIWDTHQLRSYDLALCAAGIHPDASPDELNLTTGWLTWGTYADDLYPLVFGRTRDFAGARACNERLSALMPIDGEAAPEPVTPLERGLADLWSRTAGPMTVCARTEFRKAIEDMTESWLWELSNHALNRIPDPVDYIEMRRDTFGSQLTMSLSRLAQGQTVPPEVFATRPVQALESSAADAACLINDLFSYQKEIQFEGELHNGVLVVENFLECDRDRALGVVNDLITARLRQFEHIVAGELPVLYDELELDEDARLGMARYVDELRNWLSGILNWHHGCGRYTESELRNHPGRRRPGLRWTDRPRHRPGTRRVAARGIAFSRAQGRIGWLRAQPGYENYCDPGAPVDCGHRHGRLVPLGQPCRAACPVHAAPARPRRVPVHRHRVAPARRRGPRGRHDPARPRLCVQSRLTGPVHPFARSRSARLQHRGVPGPAHPGPGFRPRRRGDPRDAGLGRHRREPGLPPGRRRAALRGAGPQPGARPRPGRLHAHLRRCDQAWLPHHRRRRLRRGPGHRQGSRHPGLAAHHRPGDATSPGPCPFRYPRGLRMVSVAVPLPLSTASKLGS
jgi:germacradienol/geosmin synthase